MSVPEIDITELEDKPIPAPQIETKEIVTYQHLNRRGTLFGGQLVSWMDIAAALASFEVTNEDCVTVAIDEMEFKKPVLLGDIVTIRAIPLIYGTTSLKIHVVAYKSNKEENKIRVFTLDKR